MTILILFLTLSMRSYCPECIRVLYVEKPEMIKPFDPMLYAFEKIESDFNTDTINSLGYGGILQIGQEMTNEVNRILKLQGFPARFVLSDRLDSLKATQMWYIVQHYHNPANDLRKACKIWNPKANKYYFLKIKKEMTKIIS
jgi:hypothetical protein